MTTRQNLYLGKSGQMAAMAEFLYRGYNVAVPEVDVGDDVFVVRDLDGELHRIQVKSTEARRRRNGFAARSYVSLEQLREIRSPTLYYVYAVRHSGRWSEFIVIDQETLLSLHRDSRIGSVDSKGTLLLYFVFDDQDVQCSGVSLQQYRNNWDKWPPIDHQVPRGGQR